MVSRLFVSTALGRHVDPATGGRLGRARRISMFMRALRRFGPLNPFERAILCTVLLEDEYRLTGRGPLQADDVVIDVGAHVGSFSYLCHRLGSRRIHAFECGPETFRRLRENLAGLSGIQAEQRAVFRSDTRDELLLAQSGARGANTGSNSVMLADDSSGVDPVQTIGLDEVLARFDRVRLLKLDCEGAEFPALLTSEALGRVDEIVGEYHEVGEEAMKRLAPGARVQGYAAYRKEDLASKLRDRGFEVRLVPGDGELGLFFATRKK